MDLKHAFRLCPVRRADWDLLGVHWAGQYYIYKRLPFGLRSSPALFHKVADAFEWILLNECGLFRVLHYLDDFFFAEPDEAACAATMAGVRAHAAKLGILLEPFKEVGRSTILTFLGVELDSVAMVARLPPDKLADLLQSIPRWLTRRKCIQCELQSIIGKLSFACKVVPAGRIFLRRLIDTASSVRRNHHHISLTTECKKNFQWWLDFLPSWNGVAMMLDTHYSFAEDMEIYTDVSGTHGFGACYRSDWLRGNWEPFQTLESGKSICMAGAVCSCDSMPSLGRAMAQKEGSLLLRQPERCRHLATRNLSFPRHDDSRSLPLSHSGQEQLHSLYKAYSWFLQCNR